MRILLLALFLPACAYSVKSNQESSPPPAEASSQLDPPKEGTYVPLPKDPDACVPQRFAANAIPWDFQLDPSCPPDIYAPPKWIPPWDPEPIIK